jgi:aryl-alcohol dehydrogenase-like predicted oxidoreductase
MKIALGTVQLGVPYGNSSAKVLMSEETAFGILDSALKAGIRFFDTAIAYGLSEERIGRFRLAERSPDSIISTKIPMVEAKFWQDTDTYWRWVIERIEESKKTLGIPKHTLLQFHQCDLDFLASVKNRAIFQRLTDEGHCEEIGISVYTPEQGFAALATQAVHALQVPANIIDTRFLEGDFQDRARAAGTTLIGRSVFLQGVLIESADLPPVRRKDELFELRRLAKEASTPETLHSMSMRYLAANYENSLDYMLLGIDSEQSLRQNLDLLASANTLVSREASLKFEEARTYANKRGLINPANWNS